ncbi:chromosome segregation protein SMC [Botrimarina mediterranea]|uniref:Chromosome partition protein Smc n=1 Tax=Botrimarina mediterranea TaxID=2528022 RepID=A0A518K646_9BACT|nr:chromosome segregation protein SMC [Botrimarina mediterranea]QDV73260.1 Chromosome partition protein Smc [Botrimarina mediterranea]QDV77777.1 Chromosome partition protein Smc [Planctomycetes bacterium K2D]
MLKSLELVGFKSFAEKTRLEFPAGVTVVVGPNGSGKSNVVDAVKWVLGSQSPRSLRGAEMTDVIFNGSESRGPLNSAEVTLAFDNRPGEEGGRRLFDLDEEEIRLTRRVHRSGEGEYLVNGRLCRLKDFRELLAGTGVGADSYSIIEQGRVDAALRASPLERRLLLEEAAGISRFRLKKREAAKRLERVEQNLLRLSDIVDEVEGRLRRVRSQAGKARRYREASLRLKEARTELAAADWRQLTDERRRLDAERQSLAERIEASQAEIAEQEERLARLQDDAATDDRSERVLADARKRIAKHEKAQAIARNELTRIDKQLSDTRSAWLEARREELAAAVENPARAALTAAEETAAEYTTSLREVEARVIAATGRLQEAAQLHAKQQQSRDRLAAVLRRSDDRLANLTRRSASIAATLAELQTQLAAGRGLVDDSASALAMATEERDSCADALLAIDNTIAETQRELAQLRRTLIDRQRDAAAARERLVGLRHRFETLVEEQRRIERLNDDVGGLVHRAAATGKAAPQVYGLVADLIHVEEDFVAMVEAALGARAEHVVIDSREALLEALGEGRTSETLTTRAGFQSLEASASLTAIDQIDLKGEPGVLGRAADFIEVEPRYAPLVRRLFARTWFVDTLATAKRLAGSVGKGLNFVTLDGETLGADDSLVCGPNDTAMRVLTRREDGVALQRQIASAEQSVQSAEADAKAADQRIADAESGLVTQQASANELRAQLAAAAQRAATLEERRRQADAGAERLVTQLAASNAEANRVEARVASLTWRRDAIAEHAHREAEPATDAAAAVRAAEAEIAAQRARSKELAAAAAKHNELLASLRVEARRSGGADAGLSDKVDRLAADLQSLVVERQQPELAALRATSQLAVLFIEAAAAAHELAQSRAARRAGERIRVEVASAVAQARAEADALARRLGEVDLRRQRIDMESKSLAQRLRDDYGVDVAAAAAKEGETLGQAQRQALREEIEALRQEVQSVGPVNLESLEELDELENRFAQLSGQYQDLSQAKQSLARLTARINTDSRELFQTTYETVREHFRELFTRLFGGGEADLLMVEPTGAAEGDDALEGGVEIVACPPGKELRSLSLLSGGEKTMTCVALLLALFRSRPSPFCLLDEVDAALDEANVGRFSGVLKDFLGSTQFVVITHSKRTMSGADTIYGITMQESGVSKQVSVRFEDVSEDGHINLRRREAEATPLRRAA